MPLNSNVFAQLRPPDEPDIIGPYQKMAALQTMQLQQQNLASEVQGRQQSQRAAAMSQQQQQAAQRIVTEHMSSGGELDDSLVKKLYGAGLTPYADELQKSITGRMTADTSRKNVESEITKRTGDLKLEQDKLTASRAKTAWDQAQAMKPKPFEAAPNSQYGSIDPDTAKVTIQGTVPPAPVQPPAGTLPLSAERMSQEETLRRISGENAGKNEPLVAIIGPDGKSILVPRSQAVNQRPANTREQGRPVTSGDANKVADFNTSLSDVGVLASVVGATGDTGTMAKLKTSLPNWATELTGWGADAKSKQAVIDRVKQVIGKTLEGGVLRKEDEAKYEKILPTIYDVKSVVDSKLKGLDAAITQRRVTLLDALEDAGYEVGKYRERGPGGQRPSTVRMVAPNGDENDVPADQVEHFKQLGAKVK